MRSFISKNGYPGVCDFSHEKDTVISLQDLIIFIHDLLSNYYGDVDNEGVGWDRSLEDDPAPGFHTECGGYVVPDNRHYFDDISLLLISNGFLVEDDNVFNAIVENFPEIRWIEKDPYGLTDDEERAIDWREIKRKASVWITAGLNYSDLPVADTTRLFNLLETIQSISNIIIPEVDLELYRTVKYNKPFPSGPSFTNLTSPPVQFTQNLRMSPKGVSLFYGASTLALSQSEAVSTSGNDYFYTGLFHTTRPMVVLDLRRIRERLSIFDVPAEVFFSMKFLQHFSEEISQPVGNESEYAPTQFITNFFRNCLYKYSQDGSKRPIEGILYDSSKTPSEWNAALFYDNATSASVLRLDDWKLKA